MVSVFCHSVAFWSKMLFFSLRTHRESLGHRLPGVVYGGCEWPVVKFICNHITAQQKYGVRNATVGKRFWMIWGEKPNFRHILWIFWGFFFHTVVPNRGLGTPQRVIKMNKRICFLLFSHCCFFIVNYWMHLARHVFKNPLNETFQERKFALWLNWSQKHQEPLS